VTSIGVALLLLFIAVALPIVWWRVEQKLQTKIRWQREERYESGDVVHWLIEELRLMFGWLFSVIAELLVLLELVYAIKVAVRG